MQLGAGRLPDDALLFATVEGGPLSPNAQSAAWADFADSIAMPDLTFHALRHTHASQLIDAGVDIVTISKRLGHATATMTARQRRPSMRPFARPRGSKRVAKDPFCSFDAPSKCLETLGRKGGRAV